MTVSPGDILVKLISPFSHPQTVLRLTHTRRMRSSTCQEGFRAWAAQLDLTPRPQELFRRFLRYPTTRLESGVLAMEDPRRHSLPPRGLRVQ